jgi:hypothetical protein
LSKIYPSPIIHQKPSHPLIRGLIQTCFLVQRNILNYLFICLVFTSRVTRRSP